MAVYLIEEMSRGSFRAYCTTGEVLECRNWSWKQFSKLIKFHCELDKCAARVYTLGGEYIQTFGENYKDNLYTDWFEDYDAFVKKADGSDDKL